MSNQRDQPIGAIGTSDEVAVESLLRQSGPREPVPTERVHRLRSAAHADWMRVVAHNRRRRVAAWAVCGLAAAAVLVAIGLGTDTAAPRDASPAFATVEALSDTARLSASADGHDRTPMRVGDVLAGGLDASTTGTGTATLRLVGGGLLRMAGDTAIRMPAANTVVLAAGTLYLDSQGGPSLEVRTRNGVVRDVGTQFEVSLTPAGLRVRVREGSVLVRRDQQEHSARAGDEILLDPSGDVTRRTIPRNGPEWASVTGAPSSFDLEGRSLSEFLAWVVGEMGWQLQFANTAVEQKARATLLHGSIQGLTAEEALAAVLPTSGVEHQLNGKVLLIGLGPSPKD